MQWKIFHLKKNTHRESLTDPKEPSSEDFQPPDPDFDVLEQVRDPPVEEQDYLYGGQGSSSSPLYGGKDSSSSPLYGGQGSSSSPIGFAAMQPQSSGRGKSEKVDNYAIKLTEEEVEDSRTQIFPFHESPSGNHLQFDRRLVSLNNIVVDLS